MAVYNEILAGRYNRFLQKLFVLKGPPPTPQLASEVIPVFPFFTGVENRILEGWQRYAAALNLSAGGAGNVGRWRFRNPNKVLVACFEKIILSNTNAAAVTYSVLIAGAVTTDLGTAESLSNQQLDLRGQTTSNLIASFDNNTAVNLGGISVFQGQIPAGQNLDIIITENQELTLANGNVGGAALHIQTLSSNVILNSCVIWRERALEDSEQSFA